MKIFKDKIYLRKESPNKYTDEVWYSEVNENDSGVEYASYILEDKEMTHQERHIMLHKHFDELLADYIRCTEQPVLGNKIEKLMAWSFEQTKNPTEKV